MLTKSNAGQVASLPPTDLQLERLPSGELAWLRPSSDRAEADDALFTLTDLGRRALAMERLFGPWPRLVDSVCCGCGAVLRPGVNIHYRTLDGRTHCDGCATAGDVEYQPTTPPAEASVLCSVCRKPSINPLRDGRCIVCELLQPATCPVCHQPQTSPSCSAREHWGVA